jgi:holo-[acyl-carrier protein] synthase
MIFGIGHDIVENVRIKRLLEQYGDNFSNKILSTNELLIFAQHKSKINYLAKRFAAKEAFAKACSTGIRNPIIFKNISILNDGLGKPVFQFSEDLQKWLSSHNISKHYISLSDEKSLSSAFVILEI